MNKPESLRRALTETNPHLRQAPESLHVFIDAGSVRANLAPGLHFTYAYTLNILITDYPGHPDSLFVPLIGWVKRHQPDLLQNPDNRDAIKFEAELLSNTTADLSIKLPLTESVLVRLVGSGLEAEHLPEPLIEEFDDTPWELYMKGVSVSS